MKNLGIVIICFWTTGLVSLAITLFRTFEKVHSSVELLAPYLAIMLAIILGITAGGLLIYNSRKPLALWLSISADLLLIWTCWMNWSSILSPWDAIKTWLLHAPAVAYINLAMPLIAALLIPVAAFFLRLGKEAQR